MIAIDANIILRALLKDEPRQTPIAQRVLEQEVDLFVPLPVVMEVVWTLRSRAKTPRDEIVRTLRVLFGQPNLTVQDESAVQLALSWTDDGMGIADALVLASAEGCSELLTFDSRFARRAARVNSIPVRAP